MVRWLSLLVVFVLLAGCAPAPASQGCADTAIFCVGVVTESGKIDSPGLNADSWEAVSRARENDIIQKAEFIETVEQQDFAKNVGFFVREKYDLVITVGYGLTETTLSAAKEYPDILFIGVDQSNPEGLPNLAGLTFAADKAGYMAGTLAALVSETKIVGAACESDYITPMKHYCESFSYAVYDADPEIRAEVRYRPDENSYLLYQDVVWGETVAQELAQAGADVIFSAGGGTALSVAEHAAENGIFVIGGGEDFGMALPGISAYLLTSLVKKVSPTLDELIQQAVNGGFSEMNVAGTFTYSAFNQDIEKLNGDVITELRRVENGLEKGDIFTGIAPEPTISPESLTATPEPTATESINGSGTQRTPGTSNGTGSTTSP